MQAKRFIKADGTLLQTLKLTFQCETHFVKAIDEGIFLDCLFFQPREFVQKGIRIIRWNNCLKLRHLSANCHSKTTCKHCSEVHTLGECSNTETDSISANCIGNHDADSIYCPKYRKELKRTTNCVWKARASTTWTTELWPSKYVSIIEISICALSDHCRIAFDRYLGQCKPEVVILNET